MRAVLRNSRRRMRAFSGRLLAVRVDARRLVRTVFFRLGMSALLRSKRLFSGLRMERWHHERRHFRYTEPTTSLQVFTAGRGLWHNTSNHHEQTATEYFTIACRGLEKMRLLWLQSGFPDGGVR